jgi:hypothetical protein
MVDIYKNALSSFEGRAFLYRNSHFNQVFVALEQAASLQGAAHRSLKNGNCLARFAIAN